MLSNFMQRPLTHKSIGYDGFIDHLSNPVGPVGKWLFVNLNLNGHKGLKVPTDSGREPKIFVSAAT